MVKVISFNLTSSRGGVTATEDGDNLGRRIFRSFTVIFNVILTRRRVDRDRRRVDIDDDGWFSSRSSRFVKRLGVSRQSLTKRASTEECVCRSEFSAPSACCRRDERFGEKSKRRLRRHAPSEKHLKLRPHRSNRVQAHVHRSTEQ